MNIRERVARIQAEIDGVAAQYDITSWERTFLQSIAERGALSAKQEQVLVELEEKVFGHASNA